MAEVTLSEMTQSWSGENLVEVTSFEVTQSSSGESNGKESTLSCSDGVLALAHINLIPPCLLILKDDLRYKSGKMNPELELSLHHGRVYALKAERLSAKKK